MDEKKALRKKVAVAIARTAVNRRMIEGRDPAKAARALEMMAEGVSWKKIRDSEGMDYYTLVALRTRHAALINQRKEMVAQDALELAEGARMLQHEKMKMLSEDESALRRANLRDLAMSYGVYADKFFMASEGNKMVVEHRTGQPSLEDAIAAINAAKAKNKAASVEIKVEPA